MASTPGTGAGRDWGRVLIGRPVPIIILLVLTCCACLGAVVVLYVTGDRTLAEMAATASAPLPR